MRTVSHKCGVTKIKVSQVSQLAHILDERIHIPDSPRPMPKPTELEHVPDSPRPMPKSTEMEITPDSPPQMPNGADYDILDDGFITFEKISDIMDEWVIGTPQSPHRIASPPAIKPSRKYTMLSPTPPTPRPAHNSHLKNVLILSVISLYVCGWYAGNKISNIATLLITAYLIYTVKINESVKDVYSKTK